VEITNTFTATTMPGAQAVAYTTLPPLVAFARDHAHLDQGGLVAWTFQEEDLGYPTKYGPLYWQSASNSSSYQIPIVSPHDGHFVPHAGSSENRVWAQRLLNIIHSSEDVRQVRSGAFSSMNNRGEFAALGMLTPNQRQAFLDRMRDTILIRMTESGPTNQEIPLDPAYTIGKQLIDPRQQWRYFDVESEDCVAVPEAFASCLWRGAGHPFDIDASAGTVLEYIYEYVLWSGDTALLASLWNGELNGPGDLSIDAIFDGVRLFHDWATMGSSHDPWGDDGSANDMAMAQYAALKSYARLAEFQGESDKAAFGRYLTAKYQIPQALRWVFLEGWVADYYKTISPEFFSNAGSYSAVLRGIGELEPSGPLRHRNHGYLEEWSDWTVSGERLHLGPYDVYRALLDDPHVSAGEQPPFGRMVESMYAGYPTPSADADGIRGAFPEAKFYAFWRNSDVAALSLLPQSAAAAKARMPLPVPMSSARVTGTPRLASRSRARRQPRVVSWWPVP